MQKDRNFKRRRQVKIGVSVLSIAILFVSGLSAGLVSLNYSQYNKKYGSIYFQNGGETIDFLELRSPGEVGNTGFEPWYQYIGDIINAANGNLFLPVIDTTLSARGFEIPIVRSYNSYRSDIDSGFGYGWTFNYNTYLTDANDYVLWIDGDGSVHNYSGLGGGNYESPPGIFSRLTKNPDDSFTLWFKEGVTYEFNTNGILQAIVDNNGNILTCTYDVNKLVRIEDNSGIYVDFSYNMGNRISSIEDPLGRQIFYEYDTNDNLILVIDAMGNSTQYIYEDASHYLSSVIDRIGRTLFFKYYTGEIWMVKSIVAMIQDSFTKSYLNPFEVFSFTYDGLWTNYTDAGGYSTSIKHNELGNSVEIIDPLDYTTSYEWDANMNVVSYTNENDNTWTYSYDGYGNLINSTDPLGYSTLYEWENIDLPDQYISLLKNVTNARGCRTQYIYDNNENQIEMIDATGNSSFMSYDTFGQLTSYTNPGGYTTTLSYDDHGNWANLTDARGNVTEYIYDLGGRQTSMTDANGYTTTYTYNENNRLTKVIDALGNVTIYHYNEGGESTGKIDANGHETQYQINILSEKDTETDAIGYDTYYRYDRLARHKRTTDAKDQQTNYIYDAKGRLLSVTDTMGNTESYTYDGVGNRISVENKRSYITQYEYDPLNRLINVSDPTGHYETYSYDPVGNRISFTDKNGNTYTYSYDPLNRLIKETDPLDYYETYSYDPVGNRISSIDKNGNPTYYEYDGLDRLIKIIDGCCQETVFGYDAVGNRVSKTNALGYTTTYFYDPLYRRVMITDALGNSSYRGYDPVGNLISSTDANGNTYTYAYDELNRLEQITDPLGYDTFLVHDELGNIISRTDANGYITTYEYDPLNRLIQETNALGYEINYDYDEEGNRINFTDANGHTSTYEYDPLNRLSKVTSPTGYEWEYYWNPVGNKDRRIDANGDTTFYYHDAANRRTAVSYPDATNYTIQYDPNGNPIQFVHNGGIGDITDKTYDEYDRVTSVTVDYGGLFTKTINYNYDDVGNLITKQDPDSTTTYTYDPLNRLATLFNPITDPFNPMVYTYDAGGRLTREECPHGVYSEYQYDGMDQVVHVETRDQWDNPYEIFDYEYDPMGNLINKTYLSGNYFIYDYDPLNRPVGYKIHPSGYIANYTWDGVNRLSKTLNGPTFTYSYDMDNRLILSTSPGGWNTDYIYDNNGNLMHEFDHETGNAIDYQYDYENRLTDINYLPMGSYVHYDYSAEGQKLKKDNTGLITYYLYGSPDVIAEMNDIGITTSYFSPDISVTNYYLGTSSCIHDDGQGGTTLFTNEFGEFVVQLDFDVFGEVEYYGYIESVENAISWEGRQYDIFTGLYEDNERYFFPGNGVYYTRCPNVYPGLNTYTLNTMTSWQTNLDWWAGTHTISYGVEIGVCFGIFGWIFCEDECEEGETQNCEATEITCTRLGETPEDVETIELTAKVLGWVPKKTPGLGGVLLMYTRAIRQGSMKFSGCWIWVKVEWEECEEESCWLAWKELDWQDKEAWHRCKVGGEDLGIEDVHEFPPSANEMEKCKDEAEEEACPD